jgi:phosphatidyl-myo-inositol alpha-mannosyltransferase
MLSPYSLSRPGGVQGQVVGLSRALRERGHQVTVLAPDDGKRSAKGARSDDLFIIGHPTGLRSNGSVAPVTISPGAAYRTQRYVHTQKVDVVHIHEPMAPAAGYGPMLRHSVPIVGTYHRSGVSRWYRVLKPAARWGNDRIEIRVAVSEAARDTAQAAMGGQYEVLFNGVDLVRFQTAVPTPTRAPTVLFLGRHEVRKGLGVLLDAFAEVPGPAELWVAGSGPASEALRRRHPVSDRVHWLGMLSDQDVASRLAGADILVAPSLRGESFGMVLLEGMAARCAVIASDLPGYRAAASGHALLVPPGDAATLAKALIEAVNDAAAHTGQSAPRALENALAHADTWSMEHLADRYVDVYTRAIESFHGTERQVS